MGSSFYCIKSARETEHVIIKTVAWQGSLLCDFSCALLCDFSCAPGRKTAAEGEWLSSPFLGCVFILMWSDGSIA